MKNVQLIVSKRAVSKVMKDFLVAVDKSRIRSLRL